jgi:hypothetical protein
MNMMNSREKSDPRAGRAGHTVAGTDKRAGQPPKKKKYGKSEEELARIKEDNVRILGIQAAKKRELKMQHRASIQAVKKSNAATAASLGGILAGVNSFSKTPRKKKGSSGPLMKS